MQNIILLTTYNIISSLVLKTQQSGWCGVRVGAASVLLLEASLIQGTSQAPPPSGLCWSCGHLELCLSVTSYVLGVRSGGCLWSLAANGTLALGAQCSSARRWWGCSCSHSSLRSRSSHSALSSERWGSGRTGATMYYSSCMSNHGCYSLIKPTWGGQDSGWGDVQVRKIHARHGNQWAE